ncbi:MAG: PQQ-like beta-propeller repeat protein [Gemmatimonadetes bacterium]|nr:PQQ-like beta-propeller repeat protein [Gemmatimonadota bacterium]
MVGLAGCVSPAGEADDGGADPRLLWQVQGFGQAQGEPVMAGDLVVVASDSGVAAYHKTTGAVAWRDANRDTRGSRRLLYYAGRVFYAGVASAGAYDVSTGTLLWRREFTYASSPDYAQPAVDDGALYLGTRDRRIVALERESGRALWDVRGDDPSWIGGEAGGVAVSGDTVYAAMNRMLTSNRYRLTVVIVALDRGSGRELWRSQSADEFTAGGAPVVAGRLLVAGGGADGGTIAVDRFTGREAWNRDLYGYVWGAPVLAGERIYLGTQAARLYALDSSSGQVAWATPLEGGSTYLAQCGRSLVVENYQIEMFDRESGKQVGRKIALAPGDFVSSGIAVSDGAAFFSGQRDVYGIRCD